MLLFVLYIPYRDQIIWVRLHCASLVGLVQCALDRQGPEFKLQVLAIICVRIIGAHALRLIISWTVSTVIYNCWWH